MEHINKYILIWSFCLILSSYGQDNSYCEQVHISGLRYQQSRKGAYSVISTNQWCQTSYPSYKQDDGSNYLFFLEATSGWQGWIIGSSLCQNLAGVVVPYSSAKDPTQVPSSVNWLELYNGNWVSNTDLSASCDTGLSTWEIIGIVFGIVLLIGVIVVIIVCCVHNSNKKPRTPQSAASRRVQVSPCGGNSTMYCNPAYNNHVRPAIWSTNPRHDLRYNRPPDPTANYSSMNNNQRNTTTTELGPPPSYQESLTHSSNQPSGIHGNAVAPMEATQTNDVRPIFSPPPQYSA